MKPALIIISLIAVTLLCIVLPIADYSTGSDHSSIGIIKDSDYDPPYYTESCSTVNKVTSCHPVHHDEYCEVKVIGDDANGWFGVRCSLYWTLHLNDRVNIVWREGGIVHYRWGAKAIR